MNDRRTRLHAALDAVLDSQSRAKDGLGNNRDYKTNARRVTNNLARHFELMQKYIKEGLGKEAASAKAYKEIMEPNRNTTDK